MPSISRICSSRSRGDATGSTRPGRTVRLDRPPCHRNMHVMGLRRARLSARDQRRLRGHGWRRDRIFPGDALSHLCARVGGARLRRRCEAHVPARIAATCAPRKSPRIGVASPSTRADCRCARRKPGMARLGAAGARARHRLAGRLAPRRPAVAVGLLLLVVLTACWAASGRDHHQRGKEFMLLCLVVYAAGNYYWICATRPQFDHWFWFWITPVLLSIGIGTAIGFSIHRLATAPHPFISRDPR
jgi:hypothetical protein